MAIEKPVYAIIKKDGNIELREYVGYICASVIVTGSSYNNSGNNAFSVLADFIFGNNRNRTQIEMTSPVITQQSSTSEKIRMTAPVISSLTGIDTYEVSFIMPSKYTMKTIPEPMNAEITLHEVPKHKSAVILFSGYSSQETIQTKTEILEKWMREHKLSKKGSPLIARYDPPWKPGFIRRNEVMIYVK
jgi:hypothetical protein